MVILSHALWQKKFGSDPGVIGQMITIDGVSREVVGVMPAGFGFPSFEAQLWIPLRMDSRDSGGLLGKGFMPAIARLRPGATIAQAQNELRPLILRAITRFSYPMARTWNADATVLPLQEGPGARCSPQIDFAAVRGRIRSIDRLRECGPAYCFRVPWLGRKRLRCASRWERRVDESCGSF